jgi:3-deoxy-D-manno-octulosonic-acid transferase
MGILYAFIIQCYGLIIKIAALFNQKAKERIRGLKQQKNGKLSPLAGNREIIWMHCASVGEFEQGRPVFEGLKKRYPECFFLLSFFSASGIKATQQYKGADSIVYLPLDTKQNARKFLGDLNFKMVLFIKYEFWYSYIEEIHRKKIPLFFISVILRPNQLFFKKYGSWFLEQLKAVDFFFVQDEATKTLLQSAGIKQVALTGDTRSDRVLEIRQSAFDFKGITRSAQQKTIVCGSIWPADEIILLRVIARFHRQMRWILVPHEINSDNVLKLKKELEKTGIESVKLYSAFQNEEKFEVLIVDAVGYLSKLYRLGDMAYVGGGFGKGIHNILEAAVYGIPVMFGPKNQKFNEAAALVKRGGGFEVRDAEDIRQNIERWLGDGERRKKDGQQAYGYLQENAGASQKILREIEERLL